MFATGIMSLLVLSHYYEYDEIRCMPLLIVSICDTLEIVSVNIVFSILFLLLVIYYFVIILKRWVEI